MDVKELQEPRPHPRWSWLRVAAAELPQALSIHLRPLISFPHTPASHNPCGLLEAGEG